MLDTLKTVKSVFFIGIAIFSMVFGAGNIVFPIAIGNTAKINFIFSFLGIFLSSVLIPLAGFIACLGYRGKFDHFLKDWIGSIPTWIVTFLAMLLLGPLGAIPRCATMAHASFSWNFCKETPLFWFGLCFFALALIISFKQDHLITFLGKFLGPINIIFMTILIIKGVICAQTIEKVGALHLNNAKEFFYLGFFESYKTLDLLAMIFYSGSIVVNAYSFINERLEKASESYILKICLYSGFFSALIFSTIYFGFCYIAAHNHCLIDPSTHKELLISAYSTAILGKQASFINGMIVLIACLNAVSALCVVFSRYLSNILAKFNFGYRKSLIFTILVSFCLSNFGFMGIDKLISPFMQLIYPVLIVVSLLGCINVLFFRREKLLAQ